MLFIIHILVTQVDGRYYARHPIYLPRGIQYHSRQLSREAYRHYNLPLTSMFHSENNILLHFLQCQKKRAFKLL